MQKEESIKADLLKLFGSGFTPDNLPAFGLSKDTARRYYREWLRNGGRCHWWRKVFIRLAVRKSV